MKKLIKRKLLSLIMSGIMIIGCLPLSGFASGAAEDETATPSDATETGTVTEDEESPELSADGTIHFYKEGFYNVNSSVGRCGLFHVGVNDTYAAYCGNHSMDSPEEGTYSYSECDTVNVRRLLAYVADHYGTDYTAIKEQDRAYISLALSNVVNGDSYSQGTAIQKAAASAYSSNPLIASKKEMEISLSSNSTFATDEASITTISGTTVTVYVSDFLKIYLNARNTVTATLPSGVYMQYNGEWYTPGSTVEIEGVSGGSRYLRLATATSVTTTKSITFTGLKGYTVYKLDTDSGDQPIYWVTTTSARSTTLTLTPDVPGNGYIRLKKSFEESECDDLSNYTLAGAVYEVYETSGAGGSKGTYIGTFTTETSGWGKVTDINSSEGYAISSGGASILNVTDGTWIYVIETKAAPNSELDTEVKYKQVTADTIVTVTSAEPVDFDPLQITITKQDSVTGSSTGTAAGTLEGAKFTINYYDVDPDKITSLAELESSGATPTRTWVYETDKDGYIDTQNTSYFVSTESSKLYMQDGDPVIPVGVITIEETEAPQGYTLDGSFIRKSDNTVVSDSDGVVFIQITTGKHLGYYSAGSNATLELTKTEIPDRADIKLKKVDSETGEPISGVAFTLTSTTTGESHILVTDENGIIDTSAIAHSKNTNANDKTSESDYAPCGIWFSGDSSTGTIDDSLGALPYDTYILHELSTDANADYVLIDDIEIDLTSDSLYKDGYLLYDLGEVGDAPVPALGTTAFVTSTGNAILPADSTEEVCDVVSYSYLTAGETYTVKGIIMDKETGLPYTDANGNYVMGKSVFTVDSAVSNYAAEKCGTVDVKFTIDTIGLAGKSLVVYEYLYAGSDTTDLVVNADGSIDETGVYQTNTGIIVKHTDITDEGQTVYVPNGRTTAKDESTNSHVGAVSDTVTIVDTVAYENLVVGKTYTVTGVLINKSTGKKYLDNNGKEVTSSVTFVAETSSGSVDVTFKFNGANLAGKKIVVFESFYYEGVEVFTHADIDDSDQTVTYPPEYNPPVKTGDTRPIKAAAGVMVVALGVAAGLIIRKRKLVKKEIRED